MHSVLVVEDHDGYRDWWVQNLDSVFPGCTISTAATLYDARILLGQQLFTLAILDINLPDGSGIELLLEISIKHPETYSIICTIYDDDKHIFSALRAGAKGYLLKDQARESQLELLRDIVRGQPPLSPGVARKILSHFAEQNTVLQQGYSPAAHLSARENDVLTLIAKGYSRPEVAGLLDISLNTVASYTKSIYHKLNISSRAEAVIEAVKLGLIDSDVQ